MQAVGNETVAAVYISKAISLLDTACNLYGDTCTGCPLRTKTNGCALRFIKDQLFVDEILK